MNIRDHPFLWQWDTNRYLDIPEADAVYVDFARTGEEPLRIAVADGGVRIPDSWLQTAGNQNIYVCYVDGTLRGYTLRIVPRPKPPDYVATPDEALNYKAGIKLISMRGIANEAQTEYSTSLVASWGNTIDNVSRSAIYSPDDNPDTEFHYKLLGVSQNSNWSGNSIFASMYRIKVIDSAETVSDCPILEVITGSIANVKNCLSLTRFKATYNISRSALAVYRLDCLKDFYASGSAFLRPQIQTVVNKVRMVYQSMPRTAAKTDNCQYGTEYIYIPDANVEAAKAYPIFEPVADYIRPLSEYPDF